MRGFAGFGVIGTGGLRAGGGWLCSDYDAAGGWFSGGAVYVFGWAMAVMYNIFVHCIMLFIRHMELHSG